METVSLETGGGGIAARIRGIRKRADRKKRNWRETPLNGSPRCPFPSHAVVRRKIPLRRAARWPTIVGRTRPAISSGIARCCVSDYYFFFLIRRRSLFREGLLAIFFYLFVESVLHERKKKRTLMLRFESPIFVVNRSISKSTSLH